MTDLRQAAQQALEALIDAANVLSAPMFADAVDALRTALEQQAEPVSMRMPKVGDKVICLEDESLGEVVSLTGGGSPDITFDDGSRGTYLLREFAELFGYAEQRQQQAEPVVWGVDWGHNGDRSCVAIIKKHHNGTMEVIATEYDTKASAPPQRPWVGLTDEDFLEACQLAERGNYLLAFQRIQTKLKERNT